MGSLDSAIFWHAVRERPSWLLLPLFERGLLRWLPDEPYLSLQHWAFYGEALDFRNPRTFNEKIAWLKAHDHRDVYWELADKLEARKTVERVLGPEWLVPVLGVWYSVDAVDFDALPDRFALKCAHGHGGVVVCRDKDALDRDAARATLRAAFDADHYSPSREWAYYEPRRRVMAEAFVDDGGTRPADYKFLCMNGRAEWACISRGLGDFGTGYVGFYDRDGEPAPFKRADYPDCPEAQGLPEGFEPMREAAEQLARAVDLPFVRVDLYEAGGHPYFSEFTFYPCGGTMRLDPPECGLVLGGSLHLPAEAYEGRSRTVGQRCRSALSQMGQWCRSHVPDGTVVPEQNVPDRREGPPW